MYLILLGAPGAGKGTQAALLSQKLKLAHIASGDLFRQALTKGTELGKQAKVYMEQGKLVPDEITIKMVLERIESPDCEGGIILDGFPRNDRFRRRHLGRGRAGIHFRRHGAARQKHTGRREPPANPSGCIFPDRTHRKRMFPLKPGGQSSAPAGPALVGGAACLDDVENLHQLVGGNKPGPVADDVAVVGEKP